MMEIVICFNWFFCIVGIFVLSLCARQAVQLLYRDKLEKGQRWLLLEDEERARIECEIVEEMSLLSSLAFVGLNIMSVPWGLLTRAAMMIIRLEYGLPLKSE